MALPLVPIAGFVARYGAVALAAYAVSRKVAHAPFDQKADDALNAVDEGFAMRRDTDATRANARFKRTISIGSRGPAFEIDARSIFKISIKQL